MNTFRISFQYKDYRSNQVMTKTIDIGLIQSIENKYTITVTSAGIPSQPSQNAFVMDSGVQRTYSFDFRRISPRNPNDDMDADSTEWSNGYWMYVMKKYLVNRWQAETDGCRITYISSDEEMYPSINLVNVYISSFTPEMIAGDNMTLKGSIDFIVGATNLSKDIAKHTITYDANYGPQAVTRIDEAQADETNYVTITDLERVSLMEIPSTWVSRAEGTYGIAGGHITPTKLR